MTEDSTNQGVPLPSSMHAGPGKKSKSVTFAEPVGNPLANYFRHAGLTIHLPSGGKFWSEDNLLASDPTEVEIFPMTARDEILMKSPDGLLSGKSVVTTIESCVPGIRDAWSIPTIDLDTILIGIRIASHGPELPLSTKCPHCEHENDNSLDLRTVLDNIPKNTAQDVVHIGELKFTLIPHTYAFLNNLSRMTFEEQRLAKTLISEDVSQEERSAKFDIAFRKLTEFNIDAIVVCVNSIEMPDGTVVIDRDQIREFITSCDGKTFNKIKENVGNLNQSSIYPPIIIECDKEESGCGKSYEVPMEFNQTSFFE